jgi:hypothetical protein
MSRAAPVLFACFMGALLVNAVASPGASAAMTLPVFSGTATAATGTSTLFISTVEGGASIRCVTSFNSFAVAFSRGEGAGALSITGCTQGGEQCRSLGGTLATIATTGEWHLVLKTISGVDQHFFLFALPVAKWHLECPGAPVGLLLLEGAFLGSIGQKAGSTTSFSLKIDSTEKAQEFTEYENDAGVTVGVSLKTSLEGGKPKRTLVDTEQVIEFGSATSIEK